MFVEIGKDQEYQKLNYDYGPCKTYTEICDGKRYPMHYI